MKEKSLKELDSQWKRISKNLKKRNLFWKYLFIKCRYSIKMKGIVGNPYCYGKVYYEEIYNRPIKIKEYMNND